MGPGMPGMGIASIFYVIAALIAPFREVAKSFRGESSAQRWKAVGRQFAMALGMVASIVLLYLGFEALVSRGLLGPRQATHLPGDYPVWTYGLGVLIVLMLALALASWVLTLRVRWGSVGEDTEQIAQGYRASIPVHEDLRPEGISKGRHRASSPPRRTPLSGGWTSLAANPHVTTAVNQGPLRGRRVRNRHSPSAPLGHPRHPADCPE